VRSTVWFVIQVVVVLGLVACRRQSGVETAAVGGGSGQDTVAAGDANQLTCKIGGTEKSFSRNAKVLLDADDGLILAGFGDVNEGEFLSMHVPRPKPGRFTLSDAPGLSLECSTNLYSSDSKDHYRASSGEAGTTLEITLTRLGRPGERVEGTFSGRVASSSPSPASLEITEGVFSVKRNRPPKK
jgi:hypothetical protein